MMIRSDEKGWRYVVLSHLWTGLMRYADIGCSTPAALWRPWHDDDDHDDDDRDDDDHDYDDNDDDDNDDDQKVKPTWK